MAKKKQRERRELSAVAVGAAGPERVSLAARVLALSPTQMALSVLGLHLGLMWLVFNPTIFTGGDNGVYVALSRALVEQGRYISLHDPGLGPHTYYPPGYPLILAAAALVGIHPWVPIKLVTVAFCGLGVAMSALWLRRHTTVGVATLAAFLVAISPGLLLQGQLELSDVPFWGLCMVAVWALEALPREDTKRVLLASAVTALAYLTRSAALPLMVAAFVWLAYERRWRQIALFAAFVVPTVLFWSWWKSANGAADLTYGEYANTFWLKDHYDPDLGRASVVDVFVTRPLQNLQRYGGVMIPLLLTRRAGGAFLALGLGLIAFALVGWARRVRRPGISEVFFPLYAGMLFVLPPVWAGERYLFPIFPLALAYAAQGAGWLADRWRPRTSPLLAGAFVVTLLLLSVMPMSQLIRGGFLCTAAYRQGERYACLPPEWQDYLGLADWARVTLPPDAVLISRKPGLFYALSDRRGIDIPKTDDPIAYFATAERSGARFLVLDRIDDLTGAYSIPAVTAYPESFCIVQPGTIEGTAILGIRYDRPRTQAKMTADMLRLEGCKVAPQSGGMTQDP